jgi:hypothetical protein
MMLATLHESKTIKCACLQLAKSLTLYVNNNYHYSFTLKWIETLKQSPNMAFAIVNNMTHYQDMNPIELELIK